MSASRWEEYVQAYERVERAENEAEQARRAAKAAYDAAAPPDRCVAHVEESPVGEHADGQPIYGPGHQCYSSGVLRDDGLYLCDKHESERKKR
jgi:hypothetical protein